MFPGSVCCRITAQWGICWGAGRVSGWASGFIGATSLHRGGHRGTLQSLPPWKSCAMGSAGVEHQCSFPERVHCLPIYASLKQSSSALDKRCSSLHLSYRLPAVHLCPFSHWMLPSYAFVCALEFLAYIILRHLYRNIFPVSGCNFLPPRCSLRSIFSSWYLYPLTLTVDWTLWNVGPTDWAIWNCW